MARVPDMGPASDLKPQATRGLHTNSPGDPDPGTKRAGNGFVNFRVRDAKGPPNGIQAGVETLRVGVLIAGAGVTGLTAAYELQRMQQQGISLLLPPQPTHPPNKSPNKPSSTSTAMSSTSSDKAECGPLPWLIAEAAPQVGGCLESRRSQCGSFLWDAGANSFRLTSEASSLVQELGLTGALVTIPEGALRFVAVDGQLLPLPHSLPSLITSPILSWRAKLSLTSGVLFGAHPWMPRAARVPPSYLGREGGVLPHPDAPSVTAYVSSLLGSEVEKKVVGAIVTGIYAGDPAALSMGLSLPSIKETVDRGLLRSIAAAGVDRVRKLLSADTGKTTQQAKAFKGIKGRATGAGRSIVNFKGGMQSFALALAQAIPSHTLQLEAELTSLQPLDKGRTDVCPLDQTHTDAHPLNDERQTEGFIATLSTPQGRKQVLARHVLLTLPPPQIARVLGAAYSGPEKSSTSPGQPEGGTEKAASPLLGSEAIQELQTLPFTSLAVVTLAFRPALRAKLSAEQPQEASTGLTPKGFGYLVSPWEAEQSGWQSLGGICVSRMFSGRAPQGSEVFTAFVGGFSNPDAIQENDETLAKRVLTDLAKSCPPGISILPDPEYSHKEHAFSLGSREPAGAYSSELYYYRVLGVRRWPRAVAQFGLRHSAALEKINCELLEQQRRQYPNCHLLIEGGWVSGVAVGDRIRAGKEAARILIKPVQLGTGMMQGPAKSKEP